MEKKIAVFFCGLFWFCIAQNLSWKFGKIIVQKFKALSIFNWIFLCKLHCFIGISITVKNRLSIREKCVFEIANQLLTRLLLYLASCMNGNAFSIWNMNEVDFILLVRC